jgi:hypothetical protein
MVKGTAPTRRFYPLSISTVMPQPIGQAALKVSPGHGRKGGLSVSNTSAATINAIGARFYAKVETMKRENKSYIKDKPALIAIDTRQSVLCKGESVYNRSKSILDATMFPKKSPDSSAVSDDSIFAGLSIALDVTGTSGTSSMAMNTNVALDVTISPLSEQWSQQIITEIAKRDHIIYKIDGRQSGMQPCRRMSGSNAIVKTKSNKKQDAINALIIPKVIHGDITKMRRWTKEGRRFRVHMQLTYNSKSEKSSEPVLKTTLPDADNAALGAQEKLTGELPPFSVMHLTVEKRICKTPVLSACNAYRVKSTTEECSLIYITPID